ncbi:hypothetical protein [Dyadobacter sp. CY356]|uniref:hypothetical protein n=1 Tax=Dyadobacter sp. CY356 TaxID=2906442 RepID=UPI001F40EDC5|nr:hypothetical protein [Dyadobacter sp. CY356]MCF0055189.1 hypothetical protein [Dyadobacter sp. CY356]
MFYNFNAHRARKPAPKQDQGLARQIFQKLTALQRRWAGFMQFHSERLSKNWLKALCLTVLASSGTYSAYLIWDGLSSGKGPKAPLSMDRLWPFDPYGSKQNLRQVSDFQRYLDSLDHAVTRDSLLQINPKQH